MTSWVPFDLLDHLWQSTLFTAAVWLVARAVRTNAARVRYWLWLAASVKFLIPLSLLVSFGERFAWRPAAVAPPPAVSSVIEQVLTPAAAGVAAAAPAAPIASAPPIVWPAVLIVAWGLGVAFVLTEWWRQWRPIKRALRNARPIDLREDKSLTVLASASMIEPGVFGIWRPVLLVPEGIGDRLTPAQLRALIAHERCHIRHHDNLTAALHMAVEAVFWFHPLVWWLERRLIEERERACDEYVLQSGSTPRDYAEGILEVCRFAKDPSPVFVAGITGSDLRRRIESILQEQTGRPLGATRAVALAICAAIGLLGPVTVGAVRSKPTQATIDNRSRFEVASIKVNKSGGLPFRNGTKGRTWSGTNIALRFVIADAYAIPVARVVGGPSWLGEADVDMRFIGGDRFDISARLPEGASAAQVPAMLRAMLADQFKLVAHTEMRDTPVYALVVARSDGSLGPRLRKASIDCDAARAAGQAIPPAKAGERGVCDSEVGGEIIGRGQSLTALARMLSLFAGRPVVDKTALTGGYDFDVRFPELETPTGGRSGDPNNDIGGGMFVAVQEQLGLKLDSSRSPLPFVVVDSVAQPTEN
jgi:uncharacterized protein (TIGR03435 family)